MRDTESGSFRLALGSFVEEYNNQVQVRWAREVVDPRRGAEGDRGPLARGGEGGGETAEEGREKTQCVSVVSDDLACVAC